MPCVVIPRFLGFVYDPYMSKFPPGPRAKNIGSIPYTPPDKEEEDGDVFLLDCDVLPAGTRRREPEPPLLRDLFRQFMRGAIVITIREGSVSLPLLEGKGIRPGYYWPTVSWARIAAREDVVYVGRHRTGVAVYLTPTPPTVLPGRAVHTMKIDQESPSSQFAAIGYSDMRSTYAAAVLVGYLLESAPRPAPKPKPVSKTIFTRAGAGASRSLRFDDDDDFVFV